ncbi:MAG: FAD-dependent oxidoreductase [Actinomycetota bacterium]
MVEKLRVIGASWCPDCKRAKTFLGQHRIDYEWVDMESNPDAQAEVERINSGKRIIPTIIFPDGSILTEPSNDELAEKLQIVREASMDSYDVVMAGGGPTALTTAIYAARENLKVLIVEKSAVGGQAGVTERFDNYPGFPDGIGGAELAGRFEQQARRYGVEILQAVGVDGFVEIDGSDGYVGLDLTLSTGAMIQTRALLIATGSTYRRTGAVGEDDLIGAGIHFCATCDGPFYKDAEEVIVLGGGNSGLEEGLFLTQFAKHVTVFEQGSELRGSKLLQEKVFNHKKMSVKLNEGVQEFLANESGQLSAVVFENVVTKERTEHIAQGVFVFIGLDPNTQWLNGSVALDDRKFVSTDQMFQTSAVGVFAAGDVRGGSTKQLASAVGEGAAAAIQIRYFLDKLGDHKLKQQI